MKIDLNVYFHSTGDELVLSKLAEILNVVTKLGKHMSMELDDLKEKVEANSSVVDSAVALLTGFKALLDAAIAAGNPQALKDLSAKLGADTQELADAVAANTPAEEPTP